jgi:hypothetical protein
MKKITSAPTGTAFIAINHNRFGPAQSPQYAGKMRVNFNGRHLLYTTEDEAIAYARTQTAPGETFSVYKVCSVHTIPPVAPKQSIKALVDENASIHAQVAAMQKRITRKLEYVQANDAAITAQVGYV